LQSTAVAARIKASLLRITAFLKPQPVEISFSPADNQRLANLCGAMDENLRQIETVLDVTIARRGEHFSVRGKSAQALLAAEALRNFYGQAQHHLSVEQIQLGLIEAMSPRHPKKPPLLPLRKNPRNLG
jgi:phosphate starvation-inducible PhoH-like protein